MSQALNLPSPCVVVLVGPGASGKSTWAAAHFRTDSIVSSDSAAGPGRNRRGRHRRQHRRVRAARGGRPAAAGSPADHRDRHARPRPGAPLPMARLLPGETDLPCVVAFDTARGVPGPQPAPVQADPGRRPGQASFARGRRRGPAVHRGVRRGARPAAGPGRAGGIRGGRAGGPAAGEQPTGLRFGLHLGAFTFGGGTAAGCAEIARRPRRRVRRDLRDGPLPADPAGRPGLGRLPGELHHAGYLAACTQRVRIGALVTGVTYRNVGHLGKIIATLDVLSGGRAVCGLGLAWFKQEHLAYGWHFPPTAERYALLEDALRVLPLLWGPGQPSFSGQVLRCRTRPVTPGRCRSRCRSWSAAAASGAPCGWPRGTPTRPTCSATRRLSAPRRRPGGALRRGRPRSRRGRPTCPPR